MQHYQKKENSKTHKSKPNNFTNLMTKNKHNNENSKPTFTLPCTGRPPRHLRFKLHRQSQEPIEPIKGNMRHMAHISRQPDLHCTELPPVSTLASNQRSPEKGHQQC